jgi:hypothetical protein
MTGRPNKLGGGRPKGSVSVRTKFIRAVSDKAIKDGITPLEVMLDNMRFYHQKVDVLQTAILQRVNAKGVIKGEDAMKMLTEFKELGESRMKAQSCAVDAAPYVHARLSSTTVSGEITHTHEEAEKAFKTIEGALDAVVYGEIIPSREKVKEKA